MIFDNNSLKQNYIDNLDNNIIEYVDIECICDNKKYDPNNKLIQCFLCHKYQHLSCIFQAKYIKPYICFNCQFKNNHFYLRWKKTILPAKEIIYSNKWIKDKSLLKKGKKKFHFLLNLNELYDLNINKNDNNSHYLAFLWLTNNGKPFHFGFPDNISIKINSNDFYSTENKQFKYPLLLSLDESIDHYPKKKHLITMENYEIPLASEYFYPPITVNYKKKSSLQNVSISFDNPLENYYGSEFEFEETRRYLFYIGVFQEIKIPQLSILRNCNKLIEYNDIFNNLYNEKVLKIKLKKISNNISSSENEEMNMNLISNISNQKIIHPIRGLFCQHSDVLDYGECCRYITSKNQIYKCYKCNKPLNVMYIDDASEKIFNEYKNKSYSEIYFNNKFKFIKGEKIDLINNNFNDESDIMEEDESSSESDSLNESFFKFYQKQLSINNDKINKIEKFNNEKKNIKNNNMLINLNDNDENTNENNNVIEILETISLSSNSYITNSENDSSISLISQEIPKDYDKINNNINESKNNNLKLLNENNKNSKINEYYKDDIKIKKNFLEEKDKNETNINNNFLHKKRDSSRLIHINKKNKSNKSIKSNINKNKNKIINKKQSKKSIEIKNKELTQITPHKNNIPEEIINLTESSISSFSNNSQDDEDNFIINEINYIHNYSTNTNEVKK